jgi:hypothetical protein
MFKKLISFDFDGTLIHTPVPETGKPEWERKTGLSWAGRGWWGQKDSLNTNIFYIPVNQWVYNQYEKYKSDDDNYVFVATGRLKRLEPQVQKILSLNDIDCDLYCNTGGDTFDFKCNLFKSLMKSNPKADELIMFDDRQEHLKEFVTWAKRQPIKVTIIDVVNKKTIN